MKYNLMYRINSFLILLFILTTLLFSCTPELDEKGNFAEWDDPTFHETSLYQLEILNCFLELQNVSIEFYSDQMDTIIYVNSIDQILNIEIPEYFVEGYLIIEPMEHDQVILYYAGDTQLMPSGIEFRNFTNGMHEDFEPTELFHITGRLVDKYGNPVANMPYSAKSYEDPNYETYGCYETSADGNLSIISKFNPVFDSVEIRIFDYERYCENFSLKVENKLQNNLNEILFNVDPRPYIEINVSDNSACNDLLSVRSYFLNQICSMERGQDPLGRIQVPYCPIYIPGDTIISHKVIFVGTCNEDYSRFDGIAHSVEPNPTDYNMDSCVPDGFFFEVTINGQTEYYDGVEYNVAEDKFEGFGFDHLTTEQNSIYNQQGFGCNDIESFTVYSKFEMDFTNPSNWEIDKALLMHNFLDNDFQLVGVITNHQNTDSSSRIRIRYNVPKI